MAQCSSKQCREEVEAGWFFCAYCGTDNRPKAFRPIILSCPHKFIESEGFCVRCGDCRDGRPSAAQREKQAAIGRNLIIFGGLLAILAVIVWQIHQNRLPGNEYVQPWYEKAYDLGIGRSLRGDDIVSGGEVVGMAFFGIGLLAMTVSKLNGRKRRSQRS